LQTIFQSIIRTMQHRSIDEIFGSCGLVAPDPYDLRKRCAAHLDTARELSDVYRWIEKELDPRMQEAYAVTMREMLEEKRTDAWDDSCKGLNSYAWEEINHHLDQIERHAQTDQLADAMLVCEQMPAIVASAPNEITQLQQVQKQIDHLTQEVEKLKADKIIHPSTALIASIYTAKASPEDRQTIEDYLRRICTKAERSMTAQLKKYLRQKQKDGYLVLPLLIKDEWEIVCQFGYNKTLKTYQNCVV